MVEQWMRRLLPAAALALCWPGPAALAADPKPLRLIAPAAPGGILDLTSRLIAKGLQDVTHQTVVVENVSGAGGTLGIMAMLKADPDGNTLVMGSLGPNAANYTLQDKLPYKPEDLSPVIHVLSMPNVLVAAPKLGVKTLAELKALSKARPAGLSMAVSTSGSSGHLTGALIKLRAGVSAVDIVYRGSAPALIDLVGGQVDFMVDNMITSLPMVRAGKLVALAVTSRERVPEMPDVPTIVESGYPDIDVTVWLGLFVSAKVPQDRVRQLNADLQKVLAMPEIRQRIAEQGGLGVGGSPEAFKRFVATEKDRWEQVIKSSGIKVE